MADRDKVTIRGKSDGLCKLMGGKSRRASSILDAVQASFLEMSVKYRHPAGVWRMDVTRRPRQVHVVRFPVRAVLLITTWAWNMKSRGVYCPWSVTHWGFQNMGIALHIQRDAIYPSLTPECGRCAMPCLKLFHASVRPETTGRAVLKGRFGSR